MSNLNHVNNKQLFKINTILSSINRSIGFSPVCILCEQSLTHRARICQNCVTQLPWTQIYCEQCAKPLPDNLENLSCGQCQKNMSPFQKLWVALDYAFPVDQLMRGGKFSQRLSHLTVLAELFMTYWHRQSIVRPEVLIPVPLHAKRLRERGYNQSLELARIIGRELGVPIDFQSVKRSKTTLAQASLSANCRRANVDHAFTVIRPMTYSRVAIVDDVFTTGNTVRALSQVLQHAGVSQIEIYCMARA